MANARLVFASSDLRDSKIYPNGNNYVLHMTLPVKNIIKVDLVSAHFPNAMYNLNSSSNVITINQNISSNSNVWLNAGRYDQMSLSNTLTMAGIATDFIRYEGHFVFSNVTSSNIYINNNEIASLMGLTANTKYTLALADPLKDPFYTGKYIYKTSNIANMTINDYMFLDIDELRTPHNLSTGPLFANTINGTDVNTMFAPIMIKNPHLSSVTNFMETKDILLTAYYPEPIASLDRLTIRWRDKYGKILNFQGLDSNSFILRLYVSEEDKHMKALDSLPPPVDISWPVPAHYYIWAVLAAGLVLILLMRR